MGGTVWGCVLTSIGGVPPPIGGVSNSLAGCGIRLNLTPDLELNPYSLGATRGEGKFATTLAY